MSGHGNQDADYLAGRGPSKPYDIMKRKAEQTALMHQLLRELPLLENLAMRAGLPITCRAIQNAVRASGWEAAGDTERANYYAPNTEGFGGTRGVALPPLDLATVAVGEPEDVRAWLVSRRTAGVEGPDHG